MVTGFLILHLMFTQIKKCYAKKSLFHLSTQKLVQISIYCFLHSGNSSLNQFMRSDLTKKVTLYQSTSLVRIKYVFATLRKIPPRSTYLCSAYQILEPYGAQAYSVVPGEVEPLGTVGISPNFFFSGGDSCTFLLFSLWVFFLINWQLAKLFF